MALSELPLASGREHAKVFVALGWTIRRNGEHLVLKKSGTGMISIPNHREVKRQTLSRIIQHAGLTDEVYRQAYEAL